MRPWLPVVLLVACARSTPPAAPAEAGMQAATETAPAPSTIPATKGNPPPLLRDMVDHYGVMTDARDRLIRGDVAGAQERLTWVATREVNPDLPADLQMYAYGMKRDAGQVRDAGNAGQTAEALANAVSWCGKCHAAADVHLDLRAGAVPEGTEVIHHMARHQWVADRFWDALVTPSDPAWAQGVAVLRDDALLADAVPHEADRTAIVSAMAKLVHDLGLEAEEAHETIDRATVVGSLYATCADCHAERDAARK